ncbi:MAG: hypothetical protein Q4P72_03085 [Eubacteriales bacterium]|nr:hypothetical protein [Eubacteriales bacterium]
MSKSFKLFSFSPLIAAYLLVQAIGGGVPVDEYRYENYVDSVEISMFQRLDIEDDVPQHKLLQLPRKSKKKQSSLRSFFANTQVTPDFDMDLCRGRLEARYEVNLDDEALIVKRLDNRRIFNSEHPKNEERIAFIRIDRDPNYTGDGFTLLNVRIDIERDDSEIWQRLWEKHSSYFHVIEYHDEMRFEPIPDSGLDPEDIEDDDSYVLFDFDGDTLQLQVKLGWELKPQVESSTSPAPIVTAAPTYPAANVTKTYLDYAHEAGIYEQVNLLIFPDYASAVDFVSGCETEKSMELYYYANMSDEEKANYTWTSYLIVNDFQSWQIIDHGPFVILNFSSGFILDGLCN